MPSFETRRQVMHSAQNMFDLVADIEKYPEFLPLCTGLVVLSEKEDDKGRVVLVANMSVGYKAIRERFTSRVTLDRENLTVLVSYVDGPFSHLENSWQFSQEGDLPSEVHFYIDYTFRSRTLGMVMGKVFNSAFRRFAEAFEHRADVVYGIDAPQARDAVAGE